MPDENIPSASEEAPEAGGEEGAPKEAVDIEKIEQKMMSWLGRRDKELFSKLGDELGSLRAELSELRKGDVEPPDPGDILSDPEKVVTDIINRKQQGIDNFKGAVSTTIGKMMERDPLYEDKDLGNAVVEGVINAIRQNDMRFDVPADVEAERLLLKITKNVMPKKGTAFDGRKATDKKLGTLAGDNGSKSKGKAPDLDELTASMAKKWGYKEDDLARVFGGK